MVEYSKVIVKLSHIQLKKLKTAVKDELSHELLLTKRQKTKLRHSFNNNMSTDLKLKFLK